MGRVTSYVQRNFHKTLIWHFSRNFPGQKEVVEGFFLSSFWIYPTTSLIYTKWWKEKTFNQEYFTWQEFHSGKIIVQIWIHISISIAIYLSMTNEYIKNRNRLTDIENKLVVTGGEREGGGSRKRYEIKGHITIYKIINKNILYSIGHNGIIKPLFCNNSKWNVIYKNIESLCCTPKTNVIF